jgi:hypothetical protein
VRQKEQARADRLAAQLISFDSNTRPLLGLRAVISRRTLVLQLIDSLRRIEYAHFIRDAKIDAKRKDPSNPIFDPLRAAVLYMRSGQFDEAFWLVFLFVHFGKHPVDGWRLVRDIYGGLGNGIWTWRKVSADPDSFRDWLSVNQEKLTNDGVARRFGNHRKYETLNVLSPTGTAAVVSSYVAWVGPRRMHQQLIQDAHKQVGQNPRAVFDYLYKSMNAVRRFGRLAKFDYLTMLGKLGLAPIEPGSAYLNEATGPLKGARLLFCGDAAASANSRELDTWLSELDDTLEVGMQVLEDSLCNWQRSPSKYVHFRG